MQSKLIVKNFGPIKHAELDLRNVNVFIGPQASGKSTLAKLFTIFKAPRKFIGGNEINSGNKEFVFRAFRTTLEEYNIVSYLKDDSDVYYISTLHEIRLTNNTITYNAKLFIEIEIIRVLCRNFEQNKKDIFNNIKKITETFNYIEYLLAKECNLKTDEIGPNAKRSIVKFTHFEEHFNQKKIINFLDICSDIEKYLSTDTSLYIPAERAFSHVIRKSAFNLLKYNVPIPRHILSFCAELEKSNVNEIDLSFLQKTLKYKKIKENDRVFFSENTSVSLLESASGIQSVLPILIPIENVSEEIRHHSFVIEEPEMNLFPTAQYELIKRLETTRIVSESDDSGAIHLYTTHSPYILSSFNNLLYGAKVGIKLFEKYQQTHSETEFKNEGLNVAKKIHLTINKITNTLTMPETFSAYQISNGGAESIFDRNTGLIKDNFIDESSDAIDDDFEKLMELLK